MNPVGCSPWLRWRVLAPMVMILGSGCAKAETLADRQVAELRETLPQIQADNDRFERKQPPEDAPPLIREPVTASPPPEPPRVVRIGSADDGEGADPNEATTRPQIRLSGVPEPRGHSSASRSNDLDPESFASGAADGPSSSALDPSARRAYDRALALVQGKHYDRGLDALTTFLTKWPDHPYAENALYWRGEAYFAKGEYLLAAEQFEAVLTKGTTGNKAPDALLKLGMCHDRLGSHDRAAEYWTRLTTEYPRSSAARKVPTTRSPRAPKESR